MHRTAGARLSHAASPQDRYRTLIELSPQAVWDADPRGRVIYANQWWLDYCGLTLEQVRGHGWLRTIHPDYVGRARQGWAAATRQSDSYELEAPLRRGADGQYRWFLLRARSVRDDDGRVLRWVGIGIDIHDRRNAEQALRRSEEMLRDREAQLSTVTDTMPQIVWSARADGCHDFFNARWYEFVGLPRVDAAGGAPAASDPPWSVFLHPDDFALAGRAWRRSLETGAPYEIEYRLRRHDGMYRWFIARALPLRDASGTVVRWFGTCTDIEDKKAAELALQQADRSKDEFLAMLGHELRNPLAPVTNALHALDRVGEDPDLRQRCVEILRRQTLHMTRLVDDLLEVSRITQGRIELRKTRLVLTDAVRLAAETARPMIDERGHELLLRLPAEPLHVRADPVRIAQAVTNLLHNAAKYTEPGGRIEVSVRADGGDAVIRVADNGPGIPAALLPRIFDLFTQGERTIERAQGGLGIGLALVRRLMQLHGGSASVDSAGPGQGAAFTLRLPLDASDGSGPDGAAAARSEDH